MREVQLPPPREAEVHRCAFCGYDIPVEPLRADSGVTFCSEHCSSAYAGGDEPFADRYDFKRFLTGVSALDPLLPEGIPANSFVLMAGDSGIRHRGLQTELVWRTLRRGEPAIMITYVDPPIAVLEHFLTFGWNVLPFVESGQLHVIDCYTNRLREEHQTPELQVGWNEFLGEFLDEAVTTVADTTNLREVEDDLHDRLAAQEMVGSGIVIIDSLDEVEIQSRESETEQFIKEVRGDVCSRKYVPIFASTTRTDDGRFAQEHAYLFDAIVDMRRNESLVGGVRLKQLSIRKMDGVRYRPHWAAYENTGQAGFQQFDPLREFSSMYGYLPPQSEGGHEGSRPQ